MPTLQAVLPCPSGFALTGVGADRIYTGAPVSTRRGHTLILICKKKYLNCIRKWEVCIVYTEFIMKSYCLWSFFVDVFFLGGHYLACQSSIFKGIILPISSTYLLHNAFQSNPIHTYTYRIRAYSYSYHRSNKDYFPNTRFYLYPRQIREHICINQITSSTHLLTPIKKEYLKAHHLHM